MDQAQRDILISKRVELVENLDMTGGLFTQLLARKILNQRKVNEFKLQRTPEAQAEELLSFLPKRDCFNSFCEALRADGQDNIVDNFLTVAKKPAAKETLPETSTDAQDLTSTSSLHQQRVQPDLLQERETPDCAISSPSKKRPPIVYARHPSNPSSPAILCIKESDEKHVYIKYDNPPSPAKRPKTQIDHGGGVVVPFGGDENNTRYALKHYVSNEDKEMVDSGAKSLLLHHHTSSLPMDPQILVLENGQSLTENMPTNASEPLSRYGTSFAWQRQQAEKPFEDSIGGVNSYYNSHSPSIPSLKSTSSSPLKLKDHPVNENDRLPSQHLLGGRSPSSISVFQTLGQANNIRDVCSEKSPIKNPQYHPTSDSTQSRNIQFMDPQSYLQHTGVLPSAKGADFSVNRRRVYETNNLCKGDSLDTMGPIHSQHGILHADGSPVESLKLNNNAFEENQEIEIDLPDGCVNVKVEHSTRQFFLSNFKKVRAVKGYLDGDQSYQMRQIPRGLALVINVDEVEGKPPRKGTNFDRDNLCNLLTQLHFNIVVYNDNDGLSAQEMVNKLKAFAKLKDHHNYDACFICLLSHGEEGYIFGTDGKRIPLEEIFMLFGNTNCKGLIGKPKVFIIQACRGGTLDKGVRMDEPDGGSIPAKAPVIQQMPSMSDMLICYPTLMGYYAWRNRARGSWYIEAIVQVFMRYAKNEDICAMLNRVNQVVSRKVSECNQKEMNQMSQMSEYKSTLRQPHLYLFPGIGCSGL